MILRNKILIVLVVVILPFQANSLLNASLQRTVNFRGESIKVRTTEKGITYNIFPGKIKNLISGFYQRVISLETEGNHLYIKALTPLSGNIFVITEGDISYPLEITNVGEEEADVSIVIQGQGRETIQKEAESNGIVNLIKEVITGRVGNEARISNKEKTLYKDKNIKLVLHRTYTWTNYTGYLCKVENISERSVVVPIQQIQIPQLRAICADKDVLSSGEKTNVYLLVEK